MRIYICSIAALLAPIAAHAQTTPTILERDTVTTINPGAAANFSGATYTYSNVIRFNTVPGVESVDITIQPSASNISFAGTGGTVVAPTSVTNGTTDVLFNATSPGGSGQGFTFGYNGGATGFLSPAVVGGQYTLSFSGGGTNIDDTGGIFLSTVNILGDWSSASMHTTPTFGAGYSIVNNFTYSGGYTQFSVETTNFQGVSPSISFSLLGGTVGAVPEPGTWAMMIVGFGFAGYGLRRQKTTKRAALAA